ncbi:hypothetical protein [Methanosarcina sp.]|uniref:hypothetical protein n=1 Tax=Methanosarcina sp. TaxID=2213 RepID=UPI002638DE0E|nr:hypothetical protein [Methanosarcina sp.]
MPTSAKEKGENIPRTVIESRVFRIINGIAASIVDTKFFGSRSCIQLLVISSECLSEFT